MEFQKLKHLRVQVDTGHHMVTRSKSKQALIAANGAANTEPKTIDQALKLPHWYAAMKEEVDALYQNQTWTLVPRTTDMNVVGSRWVFKTKLKSDDSIDRYKARLVASGTLNLKELTLKRPSVLLSKLQL